jgi:hypothetical protein
VAEREASCQGGRREALLAGRSAAWLGRHGGVSAEDETHLAR